MRHATTGTIGTRDREGGMTLIEIMVSLGILSVLFLVILRSTLSVGDVSATLESYNTILQKTQELNAALKTDISTARRIYEEDTLGQGRSYMNNMLFGTLPPITGNLLPKIANLGNFDKDVIGNRRVGNVLMVVGELSPADYTDTTVIPNKSYRVNVFRLVCYYPTQYTNAATQGLSDLDLVRWESPAYADYTTLTAITDLTARGLVIAYLKNTLGITHAWDPSLLETAAFFPLTAIVAATPDAAYKIPPSPVRAKAPLAYFRIRNAALSQNNAVVTGESVIPKFAQKVAGFPHGFEVMVIGPSGARKILTRVVAERSMRNRVVQAKSESIATMRDI